MRTALVIVACLLPAVVVGYIALPHVSERLLEADCAEPVTDQSCAARLRNMGHVWSRQDELERAQTWYRRAAELGDAEAMFHLAWIHEERGLAVDGRELLELTRLVGSGQSLEHLAALGKKLAALKAQAQANFRDAEAWYRKSAAQGFAPSMNNLGQLYEHGWGRPADLEAAHRWHLAAAEAGNPVGQLNVATALRFGKGVVADAAEAERWATWIPVAGLTADLAEPTLVRTRIARLPLPGKLRDMIRFGARHGAPLRLALSSLEAGSELPSFQRVAEELP